MAKKKRRSKRRRVNGAKRLNDKGQKLVTKKVASLDELPEADPNAPVSITINMPLFVAQALEQLSLRMGSQSPADTISRGLSLLHELEEQARSGNENVMVKWTNGRPTTSVILGAI